MSGSERKPAWREPGFWLVMAPLLLVLVVSIGTVSLAFRVADDRVQDDYFKQGRMINKDFDLEQNALDLAVEGTLQFDFSRAEVRAELDAQIQPGELHLTFSHPVDATRDKTLILHRIGEREFRADLPQVFEGHWYLVISVAPATAQENTVQKGWRVTADVDFHKSPTVHFAAHL
jgi:uncharacterized protein